MRWFVLLFVVPGIFVRAQAAINVFPIATNPVSIEVLGRAASDGTNFLVSLLSGTNAGVQLLSSNGSLIGGFVQLGNGQLPPILGYDGAKYFVVWSEDLAAPAVTVFGRFINRNGTVSGAAFPLLQNLGSHGFQERRAVAFDGTNYLVVWQNTNSRALYGQFVGVTGSLVGGEFAISTMLNGKGVALAFDGTNYLFAFHTQGAGFPPPWTTRGQLISRTGVLGSLVQLSQTTSVSDNTLSMAFDGTNYLAVWNHTAGFFTPSSWKVHGRRISPSGNFLDGEQILITDAGSQYVPYVASDGANYLICWTENPGTPETQIKFRFFSPTAQPVGSTFTVFTPQSTNGPTLGGVFFNGNRFFAGAVLGIFDMNNFTLTSGDVLAAIIPKSTAAPRLDPTPPFVSGQFKFRLTGTPGLNYTIQMATNAATNASWTNLATGSATNGGFDFTDVSATNRSRFYRAVKQ